MIAPERIVSGPAKILAYLRMIVGNDWPGILELRALGRITFNGFYNLNHLQQMAADAWKLTRTRGVEGVYFSLNPVNSVLLARRVNRFERCGRNEGATDADIVVRRWLLIDCDPERPAGISSTEEEVQRAIEVAKQIRDFLKSKGWPDPLRANSGNGIHLLYRIDVPAADGGLILQILKALDAKFSGNGVSVDTKVGNASRICKLYGTFARKGDSTEERPHRLAMILGGVDQTAEVVSRDLLEELAATAPRNGTHRPRQSVGSSPSGARQSGPSAFERAERYASSVEPAISGSNGSGVTYRLACELVRGFDLTDSQAMEILTTYNERCEPPWSEAEMQHKISEARTKADGEPGYLLTRQLERDGVTREQAADAEFIPCEQFSEIGGSTPATTKAPKLTANVPISNYREHFTEKGERRTSPDSLPDIAARMISQLWTDHEIELIRDGSGLIAVWNGTAKRLENQNSFFAFLGYVTGFPPDFKESQGYHSRAEVFAHFLNFSPEFESVTDTPHHPRIETIRYLKEDPPGHGGEYLSQFMQRFNFATSADYDLFQSILMTPFWGGRPGSRPGSVFTPETESLRGTGKTKAMESIAELAGGSIDYGETGDEAKLTTRALSESASGKRLIIGDNVKGSAISGSGKEKLITTRRWSGHRMYKGEGSIENRFLWIFTMNGFRAGRDMAQRLIEVRFRKPERYIATWEDDLDSLLQQHRWKIIGDVLELLRGPKCPPDKLSRFAGWDAEVLGCVADPNEAQAVRFERQDACDADAEEGSEIEAIVFRKLIALGYAADVDGVFIPSRILAEWVNHSEGSKVSTTGISRKLTGLIGEKIVTKLRVRKSHSAGRGFDWIPDRWDRITVHTDIEDRRSSMFRSRASLGTDGTVQDVFGTDVNV